MKRNLLGKLGAGLLVWALGNLAAFAGDTAKLSAQESKDSVLTDQQKEDLGNIKPADDRSLLSHFHVSVQAQGEYVSNALLHGDNSSSDFLFLPTVTLNFEQNFGHGLSFNATVQSEEAVYANYSDRSFWGFSGLATLDYRPKPELPHVYVGIQPYLYEPFDHSTGPGLGKAVGVTTGIDHGFVMNKGRSLLTVGYNFTSYFSDPGVDDRDSSRVIVAFTHQFRPALYGQLFYQYEFSDYRGQTRYDSRNTAGLNFVYQFTEHLFGSVTAAYVDNSSSNPLAEYKNTTVGAGITLQY